MRRTISGNWKPLKNCEKYFLFHLNKLNMLLVNQILHILCIFIKPNVWYLWSLKIVAIIRWFLFNFTKLLQGCHFVVGEPKNFKLLADISFESGLQNTVLPSLLLYLCARYYVDLDDIQWNEVATSTACNFNNSWPLNFNFSNMINLCANTWFIKNSKCQHFFFFFETGDTKKHKFFVFLKSCYFVISSPINIDVGVFWETYVGFLKSVVLQLLPKYS